ncbi:MAG: hypothetical protein ACJAU6_003989 [Alphaproteobacteria bacterium]
MDTITVMAASNFYKNVGQHGNEAGSIGHEVNIHLHANDIGI